MPGRTWPAALALMAAAGCTSGPGAPPAADPGGTWSVELSTAPTLLALTADDVYAASYGNGVGGSQVYRVDRAAGRRVAQRTLAGQPNGLAIAPDGGLWAATVRLPDQPGGTGLQRLDPETLQTVQAVTMTEPPLSLAFVGDELWVGTQAGLRRFDRATASFDPLVPTPEPPYRLLPTGSALVVVGASTLRVVDPATGSTRATAALPAAGSVSATGRGDGFWVVYPDALSRAVLERYDAALRPVARPDSPGPAGALATLSSSALWISDPAGGRLLCADPATGTVRATHPVASTGTLVADERSVLLAAPTGLRSLPADC